MVNKLRATKNWMDWMVVTVGGLENVIKDGIKKLIVKLVVKTAGFTTSYLVKTQAHSSPHLKTPHSKTTYSFHTKIL